MGDRQGPEGGPDGLAHAGGGQLDAEEVDHVDEAQGGLEGASGAVDVEVDGVVAGGVERHELGGQLAGQGVVERAPQEDHPLVEEAVTDRGPAGRRAPRVGDRAGCGAEARHRPRSPSRQSSSMPTAAA